MDINVGQHLIQEADLALGIQFSGASILNTISLLSLSKLSFPSLFLFLNEPLVEEVIFNR